MINDELFKKYPDLRRTINMTRHMFPGAERKNIVEHILMSARNSSSLNLTESQLADRDVGNYGQGMIDALKTDNYIFVGDDAKNIKSFSNLNKAFEEIPELNDSYAKVEKQLINKIKDNTYFNSTHSALERRLKNIDSRVYTYKPEDLKLLTGSIYKTQDPVAAIFLDNGNFYSTKAFREALKKPDADVSRLIHDFRTDNPLSEEEKKQFTGKLGSLFRPRQYTPKGKGISNAENNYSYDIDRINHKDADNFKEDYLNFNDPSVLNYHVDLAKDSNLIPENIKEPDLYIKTLLKNHINEMDPDEVYEYQNPADAFIGVTTEPTMDPVALEDRKKEIYKLYSGEVLDKYDDIFNSAEQKFIVADDRFIDAETKYDIAKDLEREKNAELDWLILNEKEEAEKIEELKKLVEQYKLEEEQAKIKVQDAINREYDMKNNLLTKRKLESDKRKETIEKTKTSAIIDKKELKVIKELEKFEKDKAKIALPKTNINKTKKERKELKEFDEELKDIVKDIDTKRVVPKRVVKTTAAKPTVKNSGSPQKGKSPQKGNGRKKK